MAKAYRPIYHHPARRRLDRKLSAYCYEASKTLLTTWGARTPYPPVWVTPWGIAIEKGRDPQLRRAFPLYDRVETEHFVLYHIRRQGNRLLCELAENKVKHAGA